MSIRHAGLVSMCAAALQLLGCGGGDDVADKDAGSDKPMHEALPEGSWGSLGFDLGSTYNNRFETKLSVDNASKLTEQWTFETLGSVTGAPCIVGGHAYVVAQGRTYKFELATQKIVWQNKDAGSTSAPACTDDTIFVHTAGADLVAINAKTGKTRWKVEVDGHPLASGFSSPIVAGDKIIVGTSSTEETSTVTGATFRGSVVAFDRDSGDELWRYYTVGKGQSGATVWSTPSVSLEDEMVFVGTGNNYTGEANELSDAILALDLETGKLLWSTQLTEGDVFTTLRSNGNPDNDFGANPIVFEATISGKKTPLVAAGQKSGFFWVLDRMTGKVLKSIEVSGGSAGSGGMLNNGAYDGERLIAAGNNGKSDGPGSEPSNGESGGTSRLLAMDPVTGDIVWERQLPAFVWAPITVANGVGFVSVNKEIQAFETKTGKRLYTLETKGTIACGASISNGYVVFGSGFQYTPQITRDTTLHVLKAP